MRLSPQDDGRASHAGIFARWLLLAAAAAAPSFVLVCMFHGRQAVPGCVAGVTAFAFVFTFLSCTETGRRIFRNPRRARAIRFALNIRLYQSLLSLLPPVAMIDFFLGLIAIQAAAKIFGPAADLLGGERTGFVIYLTVTLIDGCLVTLAVLALAAIIYAVAPPPKPKFTGICINCGYDLRASTGACPECGEPIPMQIDATAVAPQRV